MKNFLILLILILCFSACEPESEIPPFREPVVPSFSRIPIPENGAYHSAFIEDSKSEEFETLAQKDIAIEMSFFGFEWTPDFPLDWVNKVRANGAVPHLTWMPGGDHVAGTTPVIIKVLNGEFDEYIDRWARQINEWGSPILLRIGHEMNGNWYSWSGVHIGEATQDQFGDPTLADGPERFIAGYRYIVDRFNDQGITNVSWVWCPGTDSHPNSFWNQAEAFYPGDEYVDWVGLDGYNPGTLHSWSKWVSFEEIYDDIYSRMSVYEKPIMIGEYASSELGGDKAAWITETYDQIKNRYTNIKAITWFHINKEADWRINSSSESLRAYQDAISDEYYLSKIE